MSDKRPDSPASGDGGGAPPGEGSAIPKRKRAERPEHYKVICISVYTEDLARLDELVKKLKAAGHHRVNRSSLIRYALDKVDTNAVPKGSL